MRIVDLFSMPFHGLSVSSVFVCVCVRVCQKGLGVEETYKTDENLDTRIYFLAQDVNIINI